VSRSVDETVAQLGGLDRGRIINIGSINTDWMPGPGLSLYAMTKGAGAHWDVDGGFPV
jgi:3-oxoacyl-[acyl-carrier protein] reductase